MQKLNANTTITQHAITHHNTNIMTSKAPRLGNALPQKKLSPEELVSVQIYLNNVIRELEA